MRGIAFTVALFGAVMVAAPALTQNDTIIIEIDVVTYAKEGSITTLAERAVDPSLVGASCTGSARTENNASEHPDNDFILSSGTSSAVIPDWEREAGAEVTMSTSLVLGDSIVVQLLVGSHQVSSGMVVITLSCAQPEPPTTTTTAPPPNPTTTTTTIAPPPNPTTTTTTTIAPPPNPTTTTTTTAPPASTTTTPPPEGGVSAGGGSTADMSGYEVWWLGGGAVLLAAALLLLAQPAWVSGVTRIVKRGDGR
ncbi:MAG: hypothetical protein BMS9Abin07_2013 [Acidimicrobiia bacterium]|nr:MAG: hypothetical protein BMS9Abin07_2013 [Acidimicrobiia bacterium]